MKVNRLVIVVLMVMLVFNLVGCHAFGKAEYQITSQQISGHDGSLITAEEREMIRALVPFYIAVTDKNIKKIKEVHLGMREMPETQILGNLSAVKCYTLNGLEDVTYINGTLKARAIYTMEIINPGTIGKTIADSMADIELTREGNVWVISQWKQIRPADNSMDYFRDFAVRLDKAKKRYGVIDLANWDGLQ